METYTIYLTSSYSSFFKCIRKMLTSCPRLPTFFGLPQQTTFLPHEDKSHESRLTRGRRNEDKDPREEEVEGQSHQHRPHPVPPYDEAGRAQRSTPETKCNGLRRPGPRQNRMPAPRTRWSKAPLPRWSTAPPTRCTMAPVPPI